MSGWSSWGESFPIAMPPPLVPKLHHAALVGFDLGQMEGDVPVELLEERDPLTDQDRQDRKPELVGQAETQAFGGDDTASDKPDAAERGPQPPGHERREIACVELDGSPGPRQLATGENEGGFVAVGPPEPPGFEPQGGLVGS